MASRKKRMVWTERGEHLLIEKWTERANDLRLAKRNNHIYSDIAFSMDGRFSAEEVHVKIKNLSKKYREERKKMDISGGSPSLWKHYSSVHRILGGTGFNRTPIIEPFTLNSTSTPSSPLLLPLPSPSPSSSAASTIHSPLPMQNRTLAPLSSPLTPVDMSGAILEIRKNNGLERVIREQAEILKALSNDTRMLTSEILSAVKVQNALSEKLVILLDKLIDKL